MGIFNIFNRKKKVDNTYVKSPYDFISWEHRNPIQPNTISYPTEIKENQTELRLSITQLNITPIEQKKLTEEWCNLFPKLRSVKQIFFYSKVNQKIFDSVCQMPQLEALFIKWSANSITTFNKIENLNLLRRLYIGSSTKLLDLKFLKNQDKLQWFEVHEQKNMNSLDGFEKLINLKGFIMSGGIHGKQKIDNISPLNNLHKLKYLGLASTYIESEDLSPICKLENLEYLDLPIYYPMKEFAKVSKSLPNCDHGLKAYRKNGNSCTKCNKETMVYPMNKRSRQLCLNCNTKKINELEIEFQRLKQESA